MALSLQATLLEHRLLHRTCKVMEEVLETVQLGRAGAGCVQSGLDLLGGPLSQITPCCLLLGVSCYSTENCSKTRGAETIWESKYFLITVSNKLLFAVNGRKWEKLVVTLMQHRLYCWKRDLVHTFLYQVLGGEISMRKGCLKWVGKAWLLFCCCSASV